jgi:hypothetical protein
MFIVVYFVMTQFGNFWIHHCILNSFSSMWVTYGIIFKEATVYATGFKRVAV